MIKQVFLHIIQNYSILQHICGHIPHLSQSLSHVSVKKKKKSYIKAPATLRRIKGAILSNLVGHIVRMIWPKRNDSIKTPWVISHFLLLASRTASPGGTK